jgi:membrane protease YdiL (CAAX protease family)
MSHRSPDNRGSTLVALMILQVKEIRMSAQRASAPTALIQTDPGRILSGHPLAAYFVIAFAGAWLVVSPLVLSKSGLGVLPITLPSLPFLVIGPLAGPTLAAFLVTNATEGKAGMHRLWRRYGLWRVGAGWYLLTLFGPLLILTLGAGALFGLAPLRNLAIQWPLVFTTYLPVILVGAILGGPIGEEPGWRGFALPRLQARYGPLVGSLLLGAIWGSWHLVGFLGGWLGPFSVEACAGLILAGMAFSVIVTWVYNHTRGSILIAILLHGASNAAVSLGPKLLPAQMPAWIHQIVYASGIGVLSYGVCALLLVAFTRGRLACTAKNSLLPLEASAEG